MVIDFSYFILQSIALFAASSTIFDVVHYLLHRWQRSRFALLRVFSSWHQVHHDFLDKNMDVHPELAKRNIYAHLIPEFITSIAGTAVFFFVMPWPTVAICVLHCGLMMARLFEEGMDFNHMASDRIDGQRGVIAVNQSYHAMHHINPLGFYSSFLNVFDMFAGTAIAMRGKRVLLTGASGSYGIHMNAALTKMGAVVEVFSLKDAMIDNINQLDLAGYDLLVMAHGLKSHEKPYEVWSANHARTAALGDAFIKANAADLVPAEIWYVGSEAEAWGWSDYAMSKRHMADYANRNWFHSKDVTYRHIVPSAFTSRMGKGLMSSKFAVAASLFLIRRGFRYIPVTYTGLAFLNRLRFIRLRRHA